MFTVRSAVAALHDRAARRRHDASVTASGVPMPPSGRILPVSPALLGVRAVGNRPASVTLLLPTVSSQAVFAGVRTAIEAAALLASRTGRSLRILAFTGVPSRVDAATVRRIVDESAPDVMDVELGTVWATTGIDSSTEDIWMPTYWTTAHAVQVACEAGLIDPDRVVSLVQDHEPSFFAASTESALAAATYHAGFRLLVNSEPLRRFLETREGLTIDPGSVFRPALDTARLERTCARRTDSALRIGFYARPDKPRNGFRLGVAALRSAAAELVERDIAVEFISMGAAHTPIDLGHGARLTPLGRLDWDRYFDELSTVRVLLSLQFSPHPSHPPLDQIASGGLAVTNDVAGSRQHLSDRLVAVPPFADRLGGALVDAVVRAGTEPSAAWDDDFADTLGRPLSTVISTLAEDLR